MNAIANSKSCFSLAKEIKTLSLQMNPIRCFQATYGALSVPALLSKWSGKPVINSFLFATSSSWDVLVWVIFHYIFSLVEGKDGGAEENAHVSFFLTDLPLKN